MRKFEIKQINDHIWLLNDNDEATGYVVAGEKMAMVIDTMNGLINVKEEAEKLTGLPLICVNTHGHRDHIGGNWCFDKVYMNPKDIELAKEHLQMPELKELWEENEYVFPEVVAVEDGQIFDLGGLTLQVFDVPGHTSGEIVLLDKKDRILFTGDGTLSPLWLQLPESLSVKTQITSMQRLQNTIRKDFDYILTGHSKALEGAVLFDELLEAAIALDSGDTANDEDYEWFRGVCRVHSYGNGKQIAYDEHTLK